MTLSRELHGYLVTVLVEKFGDMLTVEEAPDPENGLVSYRFEIHGAVCSAGFAPFDGTASVLSLNGWLGRVYQSYAEALGWLANNRAFKTLALAHRHVAADTKDLWVAANRNTLSGDIAGIRFELDDFCNELKKAITGIRLWFPQFFDASATAQFEAYGNEGMAFALRSPQPDYFRRYLESPGRVSGASTKRGGHLPIRELFWLRLQLRERYRKPISLTREVISTSREVFSVTKAHQTRRSSKNSDAGSTLVTSS